VEELTHLIIKSYGLAGAILLLPMLALYIVWKRAETATELLRAQLQAANDRVNEVHSKRVEDAKAIAEKLMTMVQENASLSKETNLALDRVGDMLSVLQANAVNIRLSSPRKRDHQDDM
jgi:hypothetical protein